MRSDRNPVPHRMLCGDCHYVGEATTELDGSDRAELLAWTLFGVPGLVYCGWRHLARTKSCPVCGGAALMRESRATAARRPLQAPAADGALVRSRDGRDLAWPVPLRTPRGRLRHGALGLLFSAGAALLASASGSGTESLAAAGLSWLTVCAWEAQPLAWSRSAAPMAAWDDQGRRLHIEEV